jgi:hypothetical protein
MLMARKYLVPWLGLVLVLATSEAICGQSRRGGRNPAKAPAVDLSEVYSKIQSVQSQVDKLSNDIDKLRSETNAVSQRTSLSTSNRTYVKAGFALLVPRRRTFPTAVDSGLGAFVGIGQYFGEHHVADFSAEWDFYPSFSLRYRYEFHLASPSLTVGPVVGYKIKIANIKPWDNFADNPEVIKNSFFFTGLLVGFPLNNAMATAELLYMVNQQNWFAMNVGVHFFF